MADQQKQYAPPFHPVSNTPSTDYRDEKDEQRVQTVTKLREKPREPRAAFWRAGRFWILLIFAITALVLSILIMNTLLKKGNEKAGIITLSVRAVYITLELNC
jgi:uncharacterized membrane protein YcjF (UPF0283 family)